VDHVELLDGWVDLARREVHRDGEVVSLTGREVALLAALAAAAGSDVPRGRLLEDVWGLRPDTQTRTLDATVRRLRRKVEPVPSTPQLLLTVHGVGYRWAPVTDPEAATTPGGIARVAAPLAQVPEDELPLVGRDAARHALLPSLQPGARVLLVGPGGVGKSALARHLARRWSASRARRAWWIPVAPGDDLDALGWRLLAELGVRHRGDEPVRALHRALGRLGSVLLVLDGVDGLPGEPLLALLDHEAVCVVATARRRLAGFRAERVRPLSVDAGVEMVTSRMALLGLAPPTGEALAPLVRAVDGLPLALNLVVPKLRWSTPEQLVPRAAGGLAPVLQAWWTELTEGQRHDLALLSLVPHRIDLDIAEALLGEGAMERLTELAEASWLQPMQSGEARWLVWLDLLRAHAEAARPAALAEEGEERLVAHLAAAVARRVDPRYGPNTAADVRWLRDRRQLLGQVAPRAADDAADQLWIAVGFAARAAGEAAAARGAWAKVTGPHGAFLRGEGLPAGAPAALRAAATVARVDLGKLDELADRQRVAEALEVVAAAGDARGVVEACRVLAYAHAHHGHWAEASAARRRGLKADASLVAKASLVLVPFPLPTHEQPTLAEHAELVATGVEAGDRELLARACVSGALTALARREVEQGVAWAQQAVDTLWGVDLPALRRGVLGNAAIVFREVARFDDARQCLQGVFREVDADDSLYRCHSLLIEASTWLDEGVLPKARGALEAAAQLATGERSRHRVAVWFGLHDLLSGGAGDGLRQVLDEAGRAGATSEEGRAALYLAAVGVDDAEALLQRAEACFAGLGESELSAIYEVRRRRGEAGTPDAGAGDLGRCSSQVRLVRRLMATGGRSP